MSEAPNSVRNFKAVITATIASMTSAASSSLTTEEIDSLILQRLKDFGKCDVGQFFLVVTRACEECVKYCQKGIDTETCPTQCLAYMNKLAIDEQNSSSHHIIEQQRREIQSGNEEIKRMSAEMDIFRGLVIALVVCMFLFGAYCTGRCLWQHYKGKGVTSGGSLTSDQVQDTKQTVNGQPIATSGQNVANGNQETNESTQLLPGNQPDGTAEQNTANNHQGELSNRIEGVQLPTTNQPSDRAFAGQNIVGSIQQASAVRTQNPPVIVQIRDGSVDIGA